MAIKYREAEELRLSTRKNLTATPENWMRFLRTASNTYKYSYSDQLMITAQFPNATAVASFDVWSDRFGRKIKSGEKGIGLIDDSGNYPKMKYVFDISQSVRYRDVPQPYVWELREEYQDEAALYLARGLSVLIEQAISDFCENTVDSLIRYYENELIINSADSTMLYGLDDTAISSEFRQVVFESVKYIALTRCGLDTSYVDEDIFKNLTNFLEVQITDILGTAISNISEQVLREIESTVKTIERRNQSEHNIEKQGDRRNTAFMERGNEDILSNNQRGQADRFDIYARSRNIRVSSESDGNGGRKGHRQMGTETQEISEKPQGVDISANDGRTQTDRSPDRDKRSSRQNDGRTDRSNDAAGRRDRAAESSQSDGVGTQSEFNSGKSRGSSDEQSDLRITDKSKQKRKRRMKKKAAEQVSPVFFPFPVGEQMSLFAAEKSEQDRANEYAMSRLISAGTGFVDGKFRIFNYFSEQHTKEEKSKFLSNEYGWGGSYGGGDEFESRPGKGITMKHIDKDHPENNITVHLTYNEAADMIDFLIQNDRFITPKDIEERQQRAIYFLKNYDPNNPLEAPQIEQAKAILDSYNIDYSQLLASQPEVETVTPEQVEEMNASIPDDTEIPDIDAPAVPIEQEESVYSESAVVAEFRNKTMESFHLIGDRTEFDIELEVEELLRQEMIDNEIAGDIEAVVLYGSRSRGLETSEDTDIDIVVQINNAELKEDALFNLFSDMDIEIDGIPVDVNPIRPEETGTIDEYLPKAEAYLEQKQAERAAQIFSSSVGEQPQVGLEVPDDSTEQVQTINPEDIKIGDRFEYNGDEYTVRALQGDQPDTVKVSYMAKQSHNLTEYEVITNIDKYVLAEQGAYLGRDEYVIDDPAITIEKYGYTIDFNRIAEIRFTRETETYLGGLDSDGHERKDSFGVSEEDTSFYLSDGYLMKYESDYGDFFPVTKESAAEDIKELIHKALTTPDMSIRITDREENISYLDRESFTITDEAEMSLETPDENEALIVEPQVIEDRVSVEIGLSESPIIDDLNERIANSTEPLTFAAVNAAFEYLDEKQHLERLDPLLNAGWYKKTDFTITAVIDGEEYSYSGRFDIGDGKGQGGGSLIDHISAYVDYTLSMTNPFHLSDEELAERQKIRDIVIPFLREHEELTQADQLFLNRLKYSYPIRVSEEQYQSLVGKTVDYNGRQYVVDRVDITKNKAHIRDDNTGWYPLFQDVELRDIVRQNIDLINSQPEKSVGTFKIYQLKSGEEYHFKRFEGLERQPEPVSISDYNLVYEGSLADIESGEDLSEKLEAIFSKFNTDRPEDFTGHSLSVSDVVVIEQDGQQQAHFVDSIGFQDVPDFFLERTQKAEQTPEQPEEVKLKSIVIDLRPKSVIEAERADQQTRESTPEEADNYRITDLSLGQRKTAVKFEDNLAAIRTLKQLEAEDRDATPEEQETLSKYTGWGGLAKVFEPENRHYQEVRELLTDDEFEAARKSTMTAFYTSPVIIKEMYAKLADMGMNGGRLLEPSCGIGNFIGMIPGSNTRVTGIELDSLTGRIAQKLYPQAQIQVCGFEHSKLKENSFDVAVGNVPFGDIHLYDKKYNPHNLLIHDYFFSKSLDMVKPGGVVAFITSKGTLDKLDPTARRLLAEKSEFLGAVRLPNNAFKANAGTEVTSDIIFLQKRPEPVVIEPDKEPLWIRTTTDSNGIEMNAYFTTHPEQICGTMTMVSGPYGMESTCEPNRDVKLSEQLKAALSNIQGKIDTEKVTQNEEMVLEAPNTAPESLRNCSYFLSDGKPFFYESGESTPIEFPKSKAKKNLAILTDMVAIRDTVRQLLEMQLDENVSDDEIKAVQATLSAMYDKFAEKYGRINDKANADVMKGDVSLPLLKSLERFDEKGEYIGKADIFSKRTIKAEHIVTEVSTSVDALAVSLSSEQTKGKVDLDYMSQLTGFDKEKIISDLQGVIFKLPDTDTYVPADEYLSGNIRQKLETAQQAFNEGDTSLAVNITALQKAMPEKLEASSIDVRLGSTWIKPEYIRDFVYQLVGTPTWHKNRYSQSQFIDVQYSPITGAWTITNKGTDKWNVQATTTYGTSDRTAYELIEDALNLKATTVKVKVEVDGKEKYVVDATKTAQARAKQELIMQKFKEWIFADKSRRDDLVETYNRQFNSSRPREYDGSHLNFVGMNPEITLRQHQLNAVARCLYGGNTLLAHEVGAGKTFEMIAAAMEGKRLGLHSKSLICVPNHLTEQIGSDFIKLYPNANILVATKKDFEKENRRALMAKIATGNYDAIIIGHSQLEKIPISQERQQQYIREQIEETMRNIEELKAMNGERYQIKQAEKTKANLEAKLQKLLDSPKDNTVTFEELGIDKLFVDEAHLFKNLFLSTKMQNVSGISTSSDVQKTADLFMKTKYMDEITGGKGIVFATGTPISNTMCEIYNMMRYLQMDKLKEMHLEHFDAWASTFGENVTQMELTPEGNSYRAKTRFSKFFNLPELMAMFKECADIQTADTLNLPGIPECEVHNVAVEPSEVQKELVDALSKRAEAIHNRQVDPSTDNMLKITTDGRKIGLDQRLINPDLPDEPRSKVNTCIDNVFRIWTDTAEIRGTQLVFCDFSTPKNDGSFNVYDDIKQKLIAKGVPEEQIAFIHDATNEVKREELFSKVRSGEIRVLIGSTSKMGAGTNVQDRLVASHDLDAPYRPADMEQRRGRMVRQGNKNGKVHLYRYCTKDTFDAYLFQMLERKQSFISQIMTSKSPQRRCDDIDEATLSYAEVKALCVGDPRIKEKMELDNEVGKLRLERSSHQQEQYRLEDMAEDIKKKISILETNIPKNQNDFLYIQKHPTRLDQDGKKIFEGITLHGKNYTDKKEAAEAFKNAYMSAIRQGGGHKDYVPVGEYRGFKVAVLFDSFSQTYKASLLREGTYFLDLGTDNFLRMDNVLDKLENVCKERIDRLSEHKKSLSEVTEQIGKPFPKEAEFKAKTARLAVLNAELDTDGRKNEQGGIIQDDTPPTQSIAPKR